MKKYFLIGFLFVLGLFIWRIETVRADNNDETARQHFFGNWGGLHDTLESHGITVESIATLDLIANVSGGLERKLGELFNYDLTFSVDTEKAGLWKNGTVFLYLLGDGGSDPSKYIGDLQVTNNIEAPNTFKVYEAWYDHSFLDGQLSILVGLHDYNSEFDSLDYAATLINSSFGVQKEISQVSPSIFPTTALTVRIKAQLGEQGYALGALYDGVPGNPNNHRGTHVIFRHDDGVFAAGEFGCVSKDGKPHFKYGLGGWYHTMKYEDFNGNPRSNNGGLYAIGEHLLLPEEDVAQGLGAFYQVGFTQSDRNQVGSYFGGGLSYAGLIPSRDSDVLAFAFALARNDPSYRRITEDTAQTETAFELTYRAEILPYFSLQPDIQYIVNPGTSTTVDDAIVAGLRIELKM